MTNLDCETKSHIALARIEIGLIRIRFKTNIEIDEEEIL